VLSSYGLSIKEFANLVEKFNPIYIQYRDKVNDMDRVVANITTLKNSTKTKVIANDTLPLIKYAHGIHLGQEDMAKYQNIYGMPNQQELFRMIRKLYPDKIVGLSTKTQTQILSANSYDIDYIGVGAYRQTNTKKVNRILGEHISYMAKISKHKVCAIGGVKTDDHIDGVDCLAICGDLFRGL
jgi:thiamine-phosphate pyrophosphorylase